MDKELLDTARDCFYFVTKFFEPINASAMHIYHSALELSPLSSVVRKLYYHQHPPLSPRVVAGVPDVWDESIHLSSIGFQVSYTWSPCGRFVAMQTYKTVVILDPLSSELLSTLAKPDVGLGVHVTGELAYSPDGCYLASQLSNASLVIWDIQTGGVAKVFSGDVNNVSLVWSLDGGKIGTIQGTCTSYTICVYDVASGASVSPGTLQSEGKPQLWAHNASFRIMTTEWDGQTCTIEISEVGLIITKINSFCIELWGEYHPIRSFSPSTYRTSFFISTNNQICILDVQSSECLLWGGDDGHGFHCFSSDGSLFAASMLRGVHIWNILPAIIPHGENSHLGDGPPFITTLSSSHQPCHQS